MEGGKQVVILLLAEVARQRRETNCLYARVGGEMDRSITLGNDENRKTRGRKAQRQKGKMAEEQEGRGYWQWKVSMSKGEGELRQKQRKDN